MKNIKDSEDVKIAIKENLMKAFEINLDYQLSCLDQYEGKDIEELTDALSDCYNAIFEELYNDYFLKRRKESLQELKTGEEAYQQAIGL